MKTSTDRLVETMKKWQAIETQGDRAHAPK